MDTSLKQRVNTQQWERGAHYAFFSQFDEPFFGVTVTIDCTRAYQLAKERKRSFFLYYLYRALKAANEIECFRYRIIDQEVYVFHQVNASPTIRRPDGTFGFAYMDYYPEETLFYENAAAEIARVKASKDLLPAVSGENVIHFSAIPWINFTGLSHARNYSWPDSAPKITFGKMTTNHEGISTMPVAIHVHHALVDASHVGAFVHKFQHSMDGPPGALLFSTR